MNIRTPYLDAITAFCASAPMAETTFGRKAVNDGKFVEHLRAGRVSLVRIERAMAYIAEHTPKPVCAEAVTATPAGHGD